jgi:PEP-CTERM motif
MSMPLKLAAAALAAALSVTPAFAEILNFSWEYAPGDVATWTQPSNPIPIGLESGVFTEVMVNDGTSNKGPFTEILYANADFDGGLELESIGLEASHTQIYTGSEAAPIFSPGRYPVETIGTGDIAFVVVTAAVPEPSTWAMMLIGFAGLGYVAARCKGAVRAISA